MSAASMTVGTGGKRGRARADIGEGQMGSAPMGSLQISVCLTGTFWVLLLPLNLLLSSQKCQGVPFSQSVKFHYFCSGPISVDPICPQPKTARREGTHHSHRETRVPRRRPAPDGLAAV